MDVLSNKLCFPPSRITFHQTHRVTSEHGWIDILSKESIYFASNGSTYIAITPLRDGIAGLFKHLVHVNISQKRSIPLTHGTFEVQKIVYWDEINNLV